jgi:hypothetical protein
VRVRNLGEVSFLGLVSGLCFGASRSVIHLTPWAGWTVGALGAVAALLALDVALDLPVIGWLQDRAWERRRRRDMKARGVAKASYDAAVETGLARSRAIGAERAARKRRP